MREKFNNGSKIDLKILNKKKKNNNKNILCLKLEK